MGQSSSFIQQHSTLSRRSSSTRSHSQYNKPSSLPLSSHEVFYSSAAGTEERLDFECSSTSSRHLTVVGSRHVPARGGSAVATRMSSTSQARRRRCNIAKPPLPSSGSSGEFASAPDIDEFEELTTDAVNDEPSTRFRWHYWKTQAWRPRNSPEQTLQLHSPICCLGVCCCCKGDHCAWFVDFFLSVGHLYSRQVVCIPDSNLESWPCCACMSSTWPSVYAWPTIRFHILGYIITSNTYLYLIRIWPVVTWECVCRNITLHL